MLPTREEDRFQQVIHKFVPQGKLLRTWKLQGGISAQVTGLEVEEPDGHITKMIVRRHGPVDLKQNPQIAADEFKLLRLLRSAGIAVPMACYLDQSNTIFPTPYLVIEYIEGQSEFSPANKADFIKQLATHLSRLHQLDCAKAELDISFLPQQQQRYTKMVKKRSSYKSDPDEKKIREILKSIWPLPERNSPVVLHGDFWPGNILWKNEEIVAIIDWEDAALGDPLADVANGRLEILWALGSEAMQEFTCDYQTMNTNVDFRDLPYWDLCAALRVIPNMGIWLNGSDREVAIRENLWWFIEQAIAKTR